MRKDIPPEFKSAVGDIIEGARNKPRRRTKVTAGEGFYIAENSSGLSKFRDVILKHDGNLVEKMADETSCETIQMVHEIERAFRDQETSLAELFKISVSSVKKIRQEFEERIDRWPTI